MRPSAIAALALMTALAMGPSTLGGAVDEGFVVSAAYDNTLRNSNFLAGPDYRVYIGEDPASFAEPLVKLGSDRIYIDVQSYGGTYQCEDAAGRGLAQLPAGVVELITHTPYNVSYIEYGLGSVRGTFDAGTLAIYIPSRFVTDVGFSVVPGAGTVTCRIEPSSPTAP